MKFYNIANHDASQKTAVIQIMEQIGYDWWTDKGVEATNFINDVRKLGELNEVFLEINSPGGNVYDGVSIANFIRNHSANWHACVVGQAASIATVIASACNTVEMGLGTNYLVHKPMSAMFGYVNADECRALAADLDTIENSVIEFYLARIEAKGKTKDELLALMKEDRYMSSDEAIEWGFVDSKSVDIKAVAFVDAKQAAKQGTLEALSEAQRTEIKALREQLAEAKRPRVIDYASAEVIAKRCSESKVDFLTNHFIESKLTNAQLDSEVARAESIAAICATSNLNPQTILANFGKPEEMLRLAVSEVIAQAEDEQDTSILSGMGKSQAKVNTHAIYDQRNKRK